MREFSLYDSKQDSFSPYQLPHQKQWLLVEYLLHNLSKAPETVSRKLKLLEDAQLIERDVKVIKILDKERLENIFE
ncbi:helix-turn-helix domain-containing protein [Lactovum miscens]|uniref:helix-turn-helix domain-containing protein n=1 Tax=Lactovum miscens TaxID=190387 RepID=UPI0032C2269D